MLESGGRKRIVHREELLLADLFVHGAELAPCRTAAEGRIGFDGQMVCRNVLYAERQHSVVQKPWDRAATRSLCVIF